MLTAHSCSLWPLAYLGSHKWWFIWYRGPWHCPLVRHLVVSSVAWLSDRVRPSSSSLAVAMAFWLPQVNQTNCNHRIFCYNIEDISFAIILKTIVMMSINRHLFWEFVLLCKIYSCSVTYITVPKLAFYRMYNCLKISITKLICKFIYNVTNLYVDTKGMEVYSWPDMWVIVSNIQMFFIFQKLVLILQSCGHC